MASRLPRLFRLLLRGYVPGFGPYPGIVLGGVLLGTAIPVWAADATGSDAAVVDAVVTDAVVTDAAVTDAEDEGSGPAGPEPSSPSPSDAAPVKGTRWALAPIRWGGTLSAGFRRHTSSVGGATNEMTYEARLRANTYLVQPWIARLNTDLGLTTVRSTEEENGSPASNNLRATSVTGSANLNVFPLSRFPFQASLSLSDSRSDGSVTNSDYRRERLTLRQEYRPARDSWRVYGQYDRSQLTGDFGDDVVDRLGGGLTFNRERHSTSLDGSYSRATSSDGAGASDLIGVGRHTYLHSDAMSVETMATYTDSEFEPDGFTQTSAGQTKSFQAFTFGSWAPSDSPWRATATARYFRTDSQIGASSVTADSLGGSGSLSYRVNRNLNLFGSANVNSIRTNDSRTITSSQSGGLSYSGTPLTFGNYSYNWYGSANLTNTAGGEAGQRAINLSAGHNLQRDWALSEKTSLNALLGQSLTTIRASGAESVSSSTLTHTAGVSLRAMPTDGMAGYLAVNLSDSQTSGDVENTFRMLNVQLSGNWRVSQYSDFNANLTWQKTEQTSEVMVDPIFGTTFTSQSDDGSISGGINFSHNRLFGVRNLRYTLNYTASTYRADSRLAGNLDAGREQVTRDLDQRLYYRIGRLRAELILRQAVVDGKENALVFLKVSRDFGAF